MTNKERYIIEKYIREVFHYEHDLSTTILARLLLLCELLVEKGLLTDVEVFKKLSPKNIAEMMGSLNYGDNEWNEEDINNATN